MSLGDSAPHLVGNFIILLLCAFRLILKPLSPLSAASWCLGCVLNEPLGQVSEVDHLRLQGPQALLLTSEPLQALGAACLDGRNSLNMGSSFTVYDGRCCLFSPLKRNFKEMRICF